MDKGLECLIWIICLGVALWVTWHYGLANRDKGGK